MFFKTQNSEPKSDLQKLLAEEKELISHQRHYTLCVEEDYLLEQVKFERAKIEKAESFIKFLLASNAKAPAELERLNIALAACQERISLERARIFQESLETHRAKSNGAKVKAPRINQTPQEIMIQTLMEVQGIDRKQALQTLGLEEQ